jgi:FAD/FMN-containing dehydrogenase
MAEGEAMVERWTSYPARPRGLSRRDFLRVAGFGAVTLASAPWLGQIAAAQEAATPVAVPNDTVWADLAGRLTGRLLRPGDAMYPAATVINSTRYMGSPPAGIAVCLTPQDAAACVNWARDTAIPFAVRSGGHSYAGFSTSPGLVIDVKSMRTVTFDEAAGTATVAGGANNADVGAVLGPYGVFFPGGRCPTVGVSGLTLGGGWGFSNRYLGMTCDSLVATELVTADGQIVTASETENPDLFWAVRGAGGGNFGVHTSFTYRTAPAGGVTVYSLSWSGGDAEALIDGVSRVQVNAPPELGLRLAVTSQSRSPLTRPAPLNVDMIGIYWGEQADAEELLAPLDQIQQPDSKTLLALDYPAARGFLAAETPFGTYQIKTGFIQGAISQAGVATMVEWVNKMPGVPSRAQESTTGLYCWGGKVNEVAPDATAFVHRNADFLFKGEVLWEPEDDPNVIAANLEWLDGFMEAMQPHLSGGAYQNFTDRTLANWPQEYYGDNFARLVEVKRAWDPGNLFRFPQSIPLST